MVYQFTMDRFLDISELGQTALRDRLLKISRLVGILITFWRARIASFELIFGSSGRRLLPASKWAYHQNHRGCKNDCGDL